MQDFDIYLASASPRRQELLQQLGVTFQLLKVDVEEIRDATESPAAYVERVARDKAKAGLACIDKADTHAVLASDTEVVLGNDVLGKPLDREDGISMLQRLSGKTHQVISSVVLMTQEASWVRHSVNEVSFRVITRQECEAYWDTGEPCDKAGGYAIQGKAAMFIEHLSGSYSGVMGLPLFETAELLKQVGVNPL